MDYRTQEPHQYYNGQELERGREESSILEDLGAMKSLFSL